MTISNLPVELFGSELSASMTGSLTFIGTLPVPAIKVIFDNQGTVNVSIFVNANTNPWRTFPGGEAIILDEGIIPEGTSFSGNGASGTFSISYLSAQNQVF